MAAIDMNPSIKDWLFFSHCSAEPGHRRLLAKMGVEPLLDIDLKIGEASGALLAVPLLRAACVLRSSTPPVQNIAV